VKRESASPIGFYTIGIAALFLAGFFLLVVFGAQSYRNTVAGQDQNMHSRSLSAYLATVVRGCDGAGAVTLRDSEYGRVLNIADGQSGYALRIYRYEGALVEDYAAQDAALSPESAERVGETESFRAELTGDVLRLETDAGRVLLHLRCEEGGAA